MSEQESDVKTYEDDIYYSPRYYDDEYEYRHVNGTFLLI